MTRKAKQPPPPKCLHLYSQKIDPVTFETTDERWLCRYCGEEWKPSWL